MPKDEVAKGNAQAAALKKIKAIKKSHPDNLAIKHFDLAYCELSRTPTHTHTHTPRPTVSYPDATPTHIHTPR